MKVRVTEPIWRRRNQYDEEDPWIPEGVYFLVREFDADRFIIQMGGQVTLINKDECELVWL